MQAETPSSEPALLAAGVSVLRGLVQARTGHPGEQPYEGMPLARWKWGEGPTEVLLLTHFDTVWPAGTLESLPWTHAGERLCGPGIFDMKAGVAIVVHALASILETMGEDALNGVTLLAVHDEEIGSPASQPLIESEAANVKACLVFEGAGPHGAIKTARKGVAHYQIVVGGLAAHAGLSPELGRNAAIEAARLILQVPKIARPELGTTVTPTLVQAGSARNTVPENAEIAIDVRAATDEELQRVDAELHALVNEPAESGCETTLLGAPHRRPMEPKYNRELFALAQDLGRQLGLAPLSEIGVGGGSDANITAALGIPTLDGLGAVGDGAHSRHEHVLLSELAPRVALNASLIAQLTAATAEDRHA